MTRVLIVAPYASVGAGLQALLSSEPELAVVAQVSGSGELRALLPELHPEVVLVDYEPADGAAVLEALDGGSAAVVLIAEERASLGRLVDLDLPGWAFLTRRSDGAAIVGAVQAAACGLVALDRSLSALLAGLGEGAGEAPLGGASEGETLTPREWDVLQLMADGLPNKTIAARLGISLHTVKFHAASVFAKLGADSRTEAVTLAVRKGLLVF